MGSMVLAYLAGVVTLLSPCVLPLLPIVLFGVLQAHKYGAWALAAGLVLSFTLFGFFVATIGFAMGLTSSLLQQIAGGLLIAFGLMLVFAPLYKIFAAKAAGLSGGLNSRVSQMHFSGLGGQFILGSVLGLVWAPCVGPTLGATIGLAAQGQNLFYAFGIMLIFAIGAVTPLLILSYLSRPAMLKWKSKMQAANVWLKPAMGLIFLLVGTLFLTGRILDFEAWLLDLMPQGLIQFLYSF